MGGELTGRDSGPVGVTGGVLTITAGVLTQQGRSVSLGIEHGGRDDEQGRHCHPAAPAFR